MGHDLRIIGQHNLDTSSQEALAKDLSMRLRVNIEFRYFDEIGCNMDGTIRKATGKPVVCGTVAYPGATKTLTLTDEFHQLRKLVQRHGDDIYDLPYTRKFTDRKRDIEVALQTDCYELYDDPNDICYAKIYTDVFDDWYNWFYSRWWSFCRAFTELDDDGSRLDFVTIYRKEVKSFLEKVGGTEAFYFDDQGELGRFTYDYYPWKTIVSEVETNYKESTLSISEFMQQENRRPVADYPLAFYDDFKDLK